MRQLIAMCFLAASAGLSACANIQVCTCSCNTDETVQVLVQHINDTPDPLHTDSTPAVECLIGLGKRALRGGVLPLLLSSQAEERMRAERVLWGVSRTHFGFELGRGWSNSDGERQWIELWKANGNYRYDAVDWDRMQSFVRWSKWASDDHPVVPRHVNPNP